METKQKITEDMHLEKEWFEKARYVETTEELINFINHVMNDYDHDYGTVVHAISACSIAAAWIANKMPGAYGGITGFQAGFVMWDFIKEWEFQNNKVGLKIVDYDDMLYPQCKYKFDKVITKDIWRSLQKEAIEKLQTKDLSLCDSRVVEHWESIADGKVPFGYVVSD